MMVLKKKELIAASLVVLIGVAGYLNWSYQDTMQVEDNSIYTETGKRLGEAEYVNADVHPEESAAPSSEEGASEEQQIATEETSSENASDYFEKARMDREEARSKSMQILNDTIANENFDEDIRKQAQEQILKISQDVEKESAIENIAKAKGYEQICVTINEDMADIIVKKDQFSEQDVVKLTEIAVEQLKIPSNNIKVVEVS